MLTKGERNYYIEVALFVTGFACIITGIMLDLRPGGISIPMWFRSLHIYIGYVMAVLVVIHLLLHSGWIAAVTRDVFKEKKKALAFLLVVVLSVASCYLAATLFTGHGPGGGNRYGPRHEMRGGGPWD